MINIYLKNNSPVKILTGRLTDYENNLKENSIMEEGKINKTLRIKILLGERKETYIVKKNLFILDLAMIRTY